MQLKSFFQTMSDGNEIWVNRWIPDNENEIKGVIQLHHGLSEHSLRYDRLGNVLTELGFVLNAYDMRGHGKTAENAEAKGTGKFGKLADKDGFNRVVEDLHETIDNLKKEYEGKKIVLLGHSFGSFISQAYIEDYGKDIDGCILCGTSGPKGMIVDFGKIIVNIAALFCGKDSVLKSLKQISFGSYNNRIKNPVSDLAWLSQNEDNIKIYEMDKWCGTELTTSFYKDMLTGLKRIHNKNNIKKIPQNLPVMFIYGTDDPVGNYGKSILKLAEIYTNDGLDSVTVKAYENDRHEIFNEADKETVEQDVINWVLTSIIK